MICPHVSTPANLMGHVRFVKEIYCSSSKKNKKPRALFQRRISFRQYPDKPPNSLEFFINDDIIGIKLEKIFLVYQNYGYFH